MPTANSGTGPADGAGEGPGLPVPGRKSTVGEVLLAYLDEQSRELLADEAAVRRGDDDAVHSMRSTARRIRSALQAHHPVVRKAAARRLGEDLRWLGHFLGDPRDAEVLRERVLTELRALPRFHDAQAALLPVERELDAAWAAGRRRLLTALDSRTYRGMLEALADFRNDPPFIADAGRRAREAGAAVVDDAARRMERSRLRAKKRRGTPEYDDALHEVRKDAKRLRYSAESVAAAGARHTAALGRAGKRIQQALGEQHDAAGTRDFLIRLAAAPGLPEDLAEAYREAGEAQAKKARDAERQYRRVYRKARRKTHGFTLR
ncbi:MULTISPECIES: CHAD domain-containing protein [Arthrobacter]|uniref:CHAD domain-containing protein n=2 Tax=Arthrobacter TaxID=1663 RepID=A0ABU9KNP4_9MICC|nr:CHAD domain-containing protein [Arthrobacter sp. YJM1]MDP5227504.1 CHAD domain-containing protein [Arthrobacter sp. YJM1]